MVIDTMVFQVSQPCATFGVGLGCIQHLYLRWLLWQGGVAPYHVSTPLSVDMALPCPYTDHGDIVFPQVPTYRNALPLHLIFAVQP